MHYMDSSFWSRYPAITNFATSHHTPANPDVLFHADGLVKLPKMVNLAICMAAKSNCCLTRQPTRQRAEQVMAALVEPVTAKGYEMEIRPGRKTDTFGVYLVQPEVVSA